MQKAKEIYVDIKRDTKYCNQLGFQLNVGLSKYFQDLFCHLLSFMYINYAIMSL
jgi:hypothetical protein